MPIIIFKTLLSGSCKASRVKILACLSDKVMLEQKPIQKPRQVYDYIK